MLSVKKWETLLYQESQKITHSCNVSKLRDLKTFSQTIQSECLNVSFSKNCGSLAKDEISVTAKIRFRFKRQRLIS